MSIVVTFWNDKSVENYLNLCTLDVMILIYRFKMIVILINELVCDWVIIDLDWEGWVCPNIKYMIVKTQCPPCVW